MKTIFSSAGNPCNLSEQKFVILLGSNHPSYLPGTIVKKISGVDGSDKPGYHFMKGFTTVCREGATVGEFCGIETKYLAELKN